MVIAIITILAGLLLPALSRARQKAKYGRWLGYKNSLRADPGLFAYYDFETGEGTVLGNRAVGPYGNLRYAPEKLNGKLGGGVSDQAPTWTKTKSRWIGKGALIFNGTDDYVDCGNKAGWITDNIFTLAAWVKLRDKGDEENIVTVRLDHTSYNFAAYDLRYSLALGDYWVFDFPGPVPIWISVRFLEHPSVGVWYYVVGVADGTWIKIYVNGVRGEIKSEIGPTFRMPYLEIGRFAGTDTRYFNGIIDEVAIYNRALTEKEIKEHYAMGRP